MVLKLLGMLHLHKVITLVYISYEEIYITSSNDDETPLRCTGY
jgi:hypothetical protein